MQTKPPVRKRVLNPLAREILESVEAQEQRAYEAYKIQKDPEKRFAAGVYVQAMNDMKTLVRTAMEAVERKPAP